MSIFDFIPEICDKNIFKNVSVEHISGYLSGENIEVHTYLPNDIIASPNSDKIKIGVVLNGMIEIMSSSDTHKVLLKTAGRGTMFGIANLYSSNNPFPSFIVAKCKTEILEISEEAFKNMIDTDHALMINFLSFLSNKIIYLNKKITSYTVGNTEQKLAYFLCENEIDGIVETNITNSDIAVMLNMGRASLYRAFDKFESEKLIERKGRIIKILNKDKIYIK